MRLNRYTGGDEKFKVMRLQPDGSYKEMPAFDYFVVALKDWNAVPALSAYADSAGVTGDYELRDDMRRLTREAANRPDRKYPD